MSKYTFENRAGVRGGTTRRNQFGNRVPGEFNQANQPLGTPSDPGPTFFDRKFSRRARPPQVMSDPTVSDSPNNPDLVRKAAALSLINPVAGAAAMAAATAPVVTPGQKVDAPDSFNTATRRTSTGGTEVWQDSETNGGRWVPTTSLTPISRGGTQGTVTDTGATPFDRRGQRTLQTTGGEVNEYDPRKDAGIAVAPNSAVPAGASRALVIDPKYQTPGASPLASITGGEITQNGGVQQLASRAPMAPMAAPVTQPTAAPLSTPIPAQPILPTPVAQGSNPAARQAFLDRRAVTPQISAIPAGGVINPPAPVSASTMLDNRARTFRQPGPDGFETIKPEAPMVNLARAQQSMNRTAPTSILPPSTMPLPKALPTALDLPVAKELPVAKDLPVALSEDEVRKRKLRNAPLATF